MRRLEQLVVVGIAVSERAVEASVLKHRET